MRILEYRITGAEAGQSVEHFLKERLHFGKKQISRLKFREEGLRLNGSRCRVSQILREGELLQIGLDTEGKVKRARETYRDSSGQEAVEQLQILYEDQDLIAVFKPGGIPVHPSHGHSRDTLWNQVVSLQEQRGEEWTPRVLGRLDRDTSGIILFAKTTEAAAALAGQRESGLLKKTYLAEAEGTFPEKEGTIDLPIEKDPDALNRMRIGKDGLRAVTRYRVVGEQKDSSLLRLELEQGRTHQIRVHLAALGHPIAGDPIYGTEGKDGKLHLHAEMLEFSEPFTEQRICIQAPLPEWLEGGRKT